MMTGTRGLRWAAVVAVTLCTADARAASFTIDLGSPPSGIAHTTPAPVPGWWGGNDVFGAQPGYVGANLTFTGVLGRTYLFTFDYFGFEAGWENELRTDGGNIRNKTGGVPTSPGTTVTFSWVATGGADVVPFSFWVFPDDGSGTKTVANGANPGIGFLLPNFFLSVATADMTGGTFLTSGTVVWVALDDSGAGPDTDHDDWVGRVSVRVPEPASLLLLGAGLIAAAGRLRRLRSREHPARRTLEDTLRRP